MAALVNGLSRLAVPLVIGAGLVQASIYDVPGGHRAVIFDRFSGVRDQVSTASRSDSIACCCLLVTSVPCSVRVVADSVCVFGL